MIDIRQQEEILIEIGNLFDKKMAIYAIGGTAMMLKGIKDATLDVDLVFDRQEDRNKFIDALKKLGAKRPDKTLVYQSKENIPIVLSLENAHFDLFLNKIITSIFSENMKERAKQIHEFGKNLIIKTADIHDIIIMKAVTSRTKDLDDIVTLIQKNPVNWDIIVNEAENQVKLGNRLAVISMGEKFEEVGKKRDQKLDRDCIMGGMKILNKIDRMIKAQVKGEILAEEKAKRWRKGNMKWEVVEKSEAVGKIKVSFVHCRGYRQVGHKREWMDDFVIDIRKWYKEGRWARFGVVVSNHEIDRLIEELGRMRDRWGGMALRHREDDGKTGRHKEEVIAPEVKSE